MDRDEQNVMTVYESWFRAMEAGDVQTALELVTDDVVFKGPGGPAVLGKEALRTTLEAFHASVNEKVSFEVQEVVVVGDWAYARVAEQATLQPKAGGDPVKASGLHLSILRHDDQHGWRIARELSSLDGEATTT